ncbi:MAG TPA: hypothetical protein VNJ08_08505 [Bacteriovoracaceae bacterium]|nr:hypothetical protein [Bacteriovoracaceae bacterium]
MLSVVFASLFLTFSTAYAQSWMSKFPGDIQRVTGDVNQACETCSGEVEKNKYQACLVEICGDRPKFISVLDRYKSKVMSLYLQGPKPDVFEQDLAHKINAIYDLELADTKDEEKLKKKLAEEISKFKKTGAGSMSPDASIMLTFFDGLPAFQTIAADEKTGEMSVDKAFLPSVDPKKRKRFEHLVNKMNALFGNSIWKLKFYSPQAFLKKKYSKAKSEAEALELYLKSLVEINDRLKQVMPVGLDVGIDIPLLQSKLKNNQLSQAELLMIMSEGTSLEMYSLIMDHGKMFQKEIVQEVSLDINTWLKGHSDKEAFDLISSKMEKSSDEKEKLQADKKAALEGCADIYRRNMATLPNDTEIKGLTKVIANSKSEFVSGLDKLRGLSAPSKKDIVASVEDIVFQPPFSAEKLQEIIFENLNNKIKIKQKESTFINVTNMVRFVPFFTYLTMHPEFSEDKEEELKEGEVAAPGEVLELCQQLEQAPFSDATMTAFGNISISFTLAQGSETYQKGVIYHELAHNLERMFDESEGLSTSSKESYGKAKTCLMGIHTYQSKEPTEKYYSEDFADFIAMKMLPPNTASPDCEYLSHSDETKQYTESTLKNSSEHDSHSSLLFRTLRASVDNSGTIPTSCSEALKNDGNEKLAEGCHF